MLPSVRYHYLLTEPQELHDVGEIPERSIKHVAVPCSAWRWSTLETRYLGSFITDAFVFAVKTTQRGASI